MTNDTVYAPPLGPDLPVSCGFFFSLLPDTSETEVRSVQ